LKLNKLLAGILALVLIAGIGNQAFAQDAMITGTSTGTPNISALPTQITNGACVLIDFEGGADLVPIGTIGETTWGGTGETLIDSDAGGNGNFANEPSPDTIAFVPISGVMDVTLTNPASQVSWFYFADADETANVYDINDVLLATITQTALAQGGVGGDPTGTFDNWTTAGHSEPTNTIKRVEFIRAANSGIDNFEFCTALVGGEFLPIETTSLLLAGAQSYSWMIPVVLSVLGIGLFVVSRKS